MTMPTDLPALPEHDYELMDGRYYAPNCTGTSGAVRVYTERTVVAALHAYAASRDEGGGAVAWQVRHHGDNGFVSQWNDYPIDQPRTETVGRFRCEYRPLYAASRDRDGERYRWLRDQPDAHLFVAAACFNEQLDAAIDAAMKENTK